MVAATGGFVASSEGRCHHLVTCLMENEREASIFPSWEKL